MANQEEILDALCSYEKKPSKEIPPVLEDFLRQVAKTGETIFPWARLKPLFIRKLDQVMEQFNNEVPFDHLTPFPNVENVKYADMRSRVVDAFEKFSGPPFTVQRICELVTEPRKHYQRSDKFLRGVEKNVMVVSTVDPYGKKISAEPPRNLMNGLDMNGFGKPRDDGDGPGDSPPFPTLSPTAWNDTGSVATTWPSVFPEQTVSHQNVSANAVSEIKDNIETVTQSTEEGMKTETQSIEDSRKTVSQSAESVSSLHTLLGHKTDTAEMTCDQSEPVPETPKTEIFQANLGETENIEANLNKCENLEANLDNIPSETSVAKEDGELSENTNVVVDEKQSESVHIEQLKSSEVTESSNSEADSGSSVDKLETDSMETNLPIETNSSTDSEVKDSTDIEQEPVLETVENKIEKHEILEAVTTQENASPNTEEPVATPEKSTHTDIPPLPEKIESETAHEFDCLSDKTVESTFEESSNANLPEKSTPVISNEDSTAIKSICQSTEETNSQAAESEISQSETEKVDQATSEVTHCESVAKENEAAVQNEAVAQNTVEATKEASVENEAEAQNEATIQNETETNKIEAVSQNEASVESEAVAVQKEAEAEEMEASTDENIVGSSESASVKESEEITSSEGMDVDPGKSEEGENSEVVSTSDQGTEEPMEH